MVTPEACRDFQANTQGVFEYLSRKIDEQLLFRGEAKISKAQISEEVWERLKAAYGQDWNITRPGTLTCIVVRPKENSAE